MKLGVLIPTRGERKSFLDFARHQIKRQTQQPDEIVVVDDPPKTSAPDITFRYRTGVQRLIEHGCDTVVFWEDDDYYSRQYIEQMMSLYKRHGSPEIFGVSSSIYYNIFNRKWARFEHAGRSSMFNTIASVNALKRVKWCEDSYSYTDLHLWRNLKGVSVPVADPLAVGIKHGIGLCGGGGHVNNWKSFSNVDRDFSQLAKWTDPEAVKFYLNLTTDVRRYKMKKDPFLSIITRVMFGKRNGLFAKHNESVANLSDIDFEQVFIVDKIGHGMFRANESFQFAKPEGKYIYLLDDDDFFVRRDFIELLKQTCVIANDPDVIFFRMKILTGDGDQIYPKPQSWQTKDVRRGQIGGSCFVVKRWVFERYIHHFSHTSFGDWNFITKVLSDPDVRVSWLDKMMSETGKVSRGNAE